MALNLRRLTGLAILAASFGCPKAVAPPVAAIQGGGTASGFTVGQTIKLDGTTSADPQNRELTFTWSFAQLPQGSATALNDAHSQTPSFTADVGGDYTVQLIVANAFLQSAPVTQKLTVSQCGGQLPVNGDLKAQAASGATVIGVGTLVALTAPAAQDPDNVVGSVCAAAQNQTLTYAWKLVAQPASSNATLNNPAASNPSFTPDVAGNYTVRLVTTDSTGRASAPTDLSIAVSTCGANAPSVDTISPTSERPGIGVSVQLAATVSDADNLAACNSLGQTFNYFWTLPVLPAGSHAQLNSAFAQNPSYTPDVVGNYTVRLVVTDSTGRQSAPKDLPLTISACGSHAPVATLPATGAGTIGNVVSLSGTVTDADTDPTCGIAETFSYHWALRALPAGSLAALNNPSGTNPSFTPDVAGNYNVELVVNDKAGLPSAVATEVVTVRACGASNPSIDTLAGPAVAINAGDTVTLTSLVSDPDNVSQPAGCGLGQTFTWAWSMISRPLNSNAFIATPSAQNATFVADVVGTYQAQLIVTDSTGRQSAPKFISVTTAARGDGSLCGTAAPTITTAPSETPAGGAAGASPNPGQAVALSVLGHDIDSDAPCSLANQTLSYNWTVVSRPAASGAVLSNPATRTPGFTPDAIGTYQFSVAVNDPQGHVSAPSFVSFTTTACGSAVPSVTATVDNSTVDPFTPVHLTAVATDADDSCLSGTHPSATFSWKQLSRPAGSSAVLSDPTSAAPTFIPDVYGSYQFQVTATDFTGLTSAPAFVNVGADSCALNRPSVASISFTGGTIGTAVALTAGAVSDLNCLASTNYVASWSLVGRPDGSQALLSAPTSNGTRGSGSPTPATSSFVPDVVGAYQISLSVTDSQGFVSDPVYTTVNATACGSAALNFGAISSSEFYPPSSSTVSATRDVGARVQLAASYTNPNSGCGTVKLTPVTYRWALVAVPSGSRAALTSTSDATPSFIPDVAGAYQVAVTITDPLGNSTGTRVATLQTTNCGANVPVAAISPSTAQNVNSYSLNTLTAQVSDLDNSGASPACPARFNVPSFSYQWSISAQPPGGNAVLSTASGSSTTFEAFTGGAYEVSLVATGSNGLVSAPARLPFNVAVCGSHAPSITQVTTKVAGSAVSRPQVGQQVDLTAAASDADSTCGDSVASYSWNVISLPSGSAVTTAAASASPIFSFTPDVAGSYQFNVVATDTHGLRSAPVAVNVNTAACGPTLLGIQPKSPGTTTPVIGSSLTLEITPDAQNNRVADSCITNPSFSYQWALLSKPAASQATLGITTPGNSTIQPDAIGTYVVQLVVTDNAGLSSAPAALTLTAGTCETTPPNPQNAPSLSTEIRAVTSPFNAGDRVKLDLPNIAAPGGSCTAVQTQPYTYRWSLISVPAGSHAQLTGATDVSPSFVADLPNSTWQVAANVTDALGNVSRTVFLTVQTTLCGANVPAVSYGETAPVVTAVQPFAINANTDLSLAATATDADSSCPAPFNAVTFPSTSWRIVTRPANSTASLTATSGSATTFRAATPGAYKLETTVLASNGQSTTSQASVTVSGCGSNAPVINQVTTSASRPGVGSAVTMTASVFDADAVGGAGTACNAAPILTPATFSWSIVSAPAGSNVQILSTDTASALTKTLNVAGTYVFSVTATDAQGLVSAPVTVTVPTGTCGPAVAGGITATSATPSIGDVVTLSSGSITDSCVAGGAAPVIGWTLTSRPAGSNATLSSATAASPTFVPDVPGNYTVQFAVTDNGGFSSVFTTGVTAGGCTSQPTFQGATCAGGSCTGSIATFVATDPQLGANATIFRDSRVQLTMPLAVGAAPGIKAGSCGAVSSTAFSYEWTLVQRPTGSNSQLSSASDVSPVFVADQPSGSYQVMLVVRDSLGNASLPYFQALPTTSDCGARKPTSAFTFLPATPNANSNITLSATAPSDPSTGCPARFLNSAGAYSYSWAVVTQAAGGQATLSATTGPSVTLVANKGGTYKVAVTTANFDGNSTVSATSGTNGDIAVSNCGAQAPTATGLTVAQSVFGNAKTAATLAVGFPATLGATGVQDLDTVAIGSGGCGLTQGLSYQWRFTSIAAGSRATLLNAGTPTPSFTPDVASGTWAVSLTLTDSLGYTTTTGPITLTSTTCGTQAPAIAHTGVGLTSAAMYAVQSIPGGSKPVLRVETADGTNPPNDNLALKFPVALAANVADADALAACGIPENDTYAWRFSRLPAGSAAGLSGAQTATPSFTPDVTGTYGVLLTVTDAQGNSSTGPELVMNVTCGAAAPVAGLFTLSQTVANVAVSSGGPTLVLTRSSDYLAGGQLNKDTKFYQGVPVQVSVTTTDADNGCTPQTTSYQWSIAAQPAGSSAQLNNPTASSPSFTPDVAGEYDLQVKLTDSTGQSSTTLLKNRVNGGTPVALDVGNCGGQAPVASITATGPRVSAGPTALEPFGQVITLDGSGSSDADNTAGVGACGLSQTLSYKWSITTAPTGSVAQLPNSTLTNLAFTPDKEGDYGISLVVSDGARTGTKTFTVTAVSGFSSAPATTGLVFTSVAHDQNGNPVVAWYDNAAGTISVARCTANCKTATPVPTWVVLPAVDANVGTLTWTGDNEPRPISVKVATDNTKTNFGHVYVAYHALTAGANSPQCSANVAQWNGTTWSHSVVNSGNTCTADGSDPSGNSMGRYLSLDLIPASSCPALAYTRRVGGATATWVEYAEDVAASCQTNLGPWQTNFVTTPTVSVEEGRWVSLRFDGTGAPHLAYFQDQNNGTNVNELHYSRCTAGSQCGSFTASEVVVDGGGGTIAGKYARLAVAPPNTPGNTDASVWEPRIAYQYVNGTSSLRIASCSGACSSSADFSPATIADPDGSGNYGRHVAMALDPVSQRPIVAYLDSAIATMKLLSGPTLTQQAAFSGRGASALSVSGTGSVSISYGDLSSQLKVFTTP